MMQSVSAAPVAFESKTMRAKIKALDAQVPVRYSFMALCAFGVLLSLFSLVIFQVGWLTLLVVCGADGCGRA